ncbi:MAG: hypothetical protein HY900_31820 [Deltaproteobacteria bacterium]|nr:hypothetical protein [Deltaproteobacteria bacterium]
MWRRGGIVRSSEGIHGGLTDLRLEKEKLSRARVATPRELWHALELRHLFLVAEMILTAAAIRTESRGAHFRSDFPEEDPSWLKSIVLREAGGSLDASAWDALSKPS